MWHPWRELRGLPEVILDITPDLPSGNAWWSPAHEVILMRKGLLQVERRCALAHELGHRSLGHSGQCDYPDAPRQAARSELHADRWAARRLIELEQLADVSRWANCRGEAADELWVTPHLLGVRLDSLHPAERGWLKRRLEHEGTA
jgi:hypothetical protein